MHVCAKQNQLSHFIIRLFMISQIEVTNCSYSPLIASFEIDMNYDAIQISKHNQYYFEPILM